MTSKYIYLFVAFNKENGFKRAFIDFDEKAPDYRSSKKLPVEYFNQFLSKSMIRKLTVSTNHYAAQREISLNSICEEIEQYIGILLHMGTVWMPDIRGYWKPETRYPPIADMMSRTRVLQIKSNFHISDNTDTNYESESYDRLPKVRELYDHVRTAKN